MDLLILSPDVVKKNCKDFQFVLPRESPFEESYRKRGLLALMPCELLETGSEQKLNLGPRKRPSGQVPPLPQRG